MTTTLTPAVPARGGQELRDDRADEHGRGPRSRGGRVGPLRDWAVFALILTGRIYRALLLTMLAVAILPMLIGWTGYVVRTGSMEPSIAPGDVVVGRPFGAHEKVPVGRVMVFDPPPASGDHGLHVHRVVERRKDGLYTTAGDANPTPDAVPVDRTRFRARGVILVRWVGLPLVWIHQRRDLPLLLWFVASCLLLGFSTRPIDGGPRSGGSRGRRLRRRLAVTGLLVLLLPQSASAAFTSQTVNGSNTWNAAADLQQRYTAIVLADNPWAFYRFDESSGTSATDDEPNHRTGTYTSVAAYGEAGALANNPGSCVRFAAAAGRMISGGTAITDPTTFSIELWFKTTSTSGGKLMGFENSRNQTSTLYDRELLLRTDGKVAYLGGFSTTKILLSPTALNNGAWHHLVVTATPNGASNETTALYVDGALVASGNTAKAGSVYTGWWRVGYGLVPSLGGAYPLSGNLTASVDQAAIYTTQLSATRISAHYASR